MARESGSSCRQNVQAIATSEAMPPIAASASQILNMNAPCRGPARLFRRADFVGS
jgi:hypothetical protein